MISQSLQNRLKEGDFIKFDIFGNKWYFYVHGDELIRMKTKDYDQYYLPAEAAQFLKKHNLQTRQDILKYFNLIEMNCTDHIIGIIHQDKRYEFGNKPKEGQPVTSELIEIEGYSFWLKIAEDPPTKYVDPFDMRLNKNP